MDKPDRGKATKILHQILLNTISYKKKSDNVTLFQIYILIKVCPIAPPSKELTFGGGGDFLFPSPSVSRHITTEALADLIVVIVHHRRR